MPYCAVRTKQKMLEEQVRRWELLKVLEHREPAREPIITISRLPGCAGRAVAEELARLMGFRLYDKELFSRIAEDAEMSEALLRSLDDRVLPALDEWITGFVLHRRLSGDYFKHLTRILFSIAQSGRAIILGRGANFILPPSQCLRVLLVAPREARVQSLARRMGISPLRASEQVRRVESDRRAFIRSHFCHDMCDPVHYDLALNTECLGFSDTVDAIRLAWAAKRGVLAEKTAA